MTLRITKKKQQQQQQQKGENNVGGLERSSLTIPKPRILLRYLLVLLGVFFIFSNYYLTKTHSSSMLQQQQQQHDKNKIQKNQQDFLWYNFLPPKTTNATTTTTTTKDLPMSSLSSSSSKEIIISKGRNKKNKDDGSGYSSTMNNISAATTTTTTTTSTAANGNANNPSAITISSSSSKGNNLLPRILVIYFPQFHPDPLNDKNWGVNFTDWVSLRGSPQKNRFGYEIPRPTELGYYDLRDTEIRRKQGQLAKQYGIDGFIYHTYWFYDTTHPGPNLAEPLLKMLQDGQPDIPFMFNWCISRWTNVWMGKAIFQKIPTSMNRMLILQEQYFNVTDEMIHEHYNWLSQFFHHRNYITVNNKPAYLIYYYDERVLPIMNKLNKYAKQDGFINGIHWIVGRSAAPNDIYVPQGLDERLTKIMSKKTQTLDLIQMDKFDQSMTYPYALEYVTTQYKIPSWCHRNHNNNNGTLSSSSSSSPPPPPPTSVSGSSSSNNNKAHPEITGIMTSFDNTPRRQYDSAYVYRPDVPEKILERFHNNLYVAMHYHKCCFIEGQAEKEDNHNDDDSNDHFVTINAWNEWAEGMSIEPSNVYGRRFLEAIRNVKQQLQKIGCSSSVVPKFEFNSTR